MPETTKEVQVGSRHLFSQPGGPDNFEGSRPGVGSSRESICRFVAVAGNNSSSGSCGQSSCRATSAKEVANTQQQNGRRSRDATRCAAGRHAGAGSGGAGSVRRPATDRCACRSNGPGTRRRDFVVVGKSSGCEVPMSDVSGSDFNVNSSAAPLQLANVVTSWYRNLPSHPRESSANCSRSLGANRSARRTRYDSRTDCKLQLCVVVAMSLVLEVVARALTLPTAVHAQLTEEAAEGNKQSEKSEAAEFWSMIAICTVVFLVILATCLFVRYGSVWCTPKTYVQRMEEMNRVNDPFRLKHPLEVEPRPEAEVLVSLRRPVVMRLFKYARVLLAAEVTIDNESGGSTVRCNPAAIKRYMVVDGTSESNRITVQADRPLHGAETRHGETVYFEVKVLRLHVADFRDGRKVGDDSNLSVGFGAFPYAPHEQLGDDDFAIAVDSLGHLRCSAAVRSGDTKKHLVIPGGFRSGDTIGAGYEHVFCIPGVSDANAHRLDEEESDQVTSSSESDGSEEVDLEAGGDALLQVRDKRRAARREARRAAKANGTFTRKEREARPAIRFFFTKNGNRQNELPLRYGVFFLHRLNRVVGKTGLGASVNENILAKGCAFPAVGAQVLGDVRFRCQFRPPFSWVPHVVLDPTWKKVGSREVTSPTQQSASPSPGPLSPPGSTSKSKSSAASTGIFGMAFGKQKVGPAGAASLGAAANGARSPWPTGTQLPPIGSPATADTDTPGLTRAKREALKLKAKREAAAAAAMQVIDSDDARSDASGSTKSKKERGASTFTRADARAALNGADVPSVDAAELFKKTDPESDRFKRISGAGGRARPTTAGRNRRARPGSATARRGSAAARRRPSSASRVRRSSVSAAGDDDSGEDTAAPHMPTPRGRATKLDPLKSRRGRSSDAARPRRPSSASRARPGSASGKRTPRRSVGAGGGQQRRRSRSKG